MLAYIIQDHKEGIMRLMPYLLSLLMVEGICIAYPERPRYVYPVASFERSGVPHILVLYQWSIDELELYDWNSSTGVMTKALSSMYTPAAVKILPDKSGFSFVDNGRIRIKRFEKRAVKSLDIYDPVYGIELIDWLDNQTCYFHAQSDGRYGIYTLTIEEELRPILTSSSADYMYPNIVGSELFYIEHVQSGRKQDFSIGKLEMSSRNGRSQTILTFGSKVLIMLTMQSAHEGFVIEVEGTPTLRCFHYHHLFQTGTGWQSQELFTFHVPQVFFTDGPYRIYESALPLVPHHSGFYLYFVSCDEGTRRLSLYRFDIQAGRSERVIQARGDLFVPVFLGNEGWCGGTDFPFVVLH